MDGALAVRYPAGWVWLMVRTGLAQGAAVMVCWLFGAKLFRAGPVPWARLVLLLGLILLVVRHFRWQARRHGSPGWHESLRWALLAGVVALTVWPYATANFVGGVDAHWYGYVLADAVEQNRGGVYPVLVGQGQYAFNGAVHPYRSAPMFQTVGMAVDRLTGQTLGAFAIQHLTVILSAGAAALAAYGMLLRLAPRRRWTAWVAATAYVASPGIIGLVATQEMYMSYMAAPWLPLLAGAVAGALLWSRWNDYAMAALGMAALWFCHSPIALWTDAAVVIILGLAAVGRRNQVRAWAGLAGLTGLAGWLLYFHFTNVGEFAGPASGGGLRAVAPLSGAILAIVLGGTFTVHRNWLAAGLALILAGWATGQAPALGGLLLVAIGGAFGLGIWNKERRSGRHGWWCLLLLVAVVLGTLGNKALGLPLSQTAKDTAAFTRMFWPGIILPIHADFRLSDLQPGLQVWLLGAVALGAVFIGARPLRGPVFMMVVFGLLLLPIYPVVVRLWGLLPIDLLVATSGAVNLRLSPPCITLMCFAGFGGLVWLAPRHPGFHRIAVCLVGLASGWSVWQIHYFGQRLQTLTYSSLQTADFLRTETAPLAIYDYNFIGAPLYFSNGVMDYHEESRLLVPDTTPALHVLSEDKVRLAGAPVLLQAKATGVNGWYPLGLTLRLAAKQKVWLHFDFLPSCPAGIILMSGQRFYREYILPSSGGELGFGSGPRNARDLPVWNSLDEPIEVTFYFVPGAPIPASGADLARVTTIPYDPAANPVQTRTLIPYRAEVRAQSAGMLETPRRYIAGYTAKVNGVKVTPIQTLAGQVGIPVPAGDSTVELSFRGTAKFWRAAWISLGGAMLIGLALTVDKVRRWRRAWAA